MGKAIALVISILISFSGCSKKMPPQEEKEIPYPSLHDVPKKPDLPSNESYGVLQRSLEDQRQKLLQKNSKQGQNFS